MEPLLSDLNECQKVDLPKRNQVTIYVDTETESKPTTASKGESGRSNVVLTTLYLDRLGAYSQVLRFLGLLSTLYVMNATQRSETSSVDPLSVDPSSTDR